MTNFVTRSSRLRGLALDREQTRKTASLS